MAIDIIALVFFLYGFYVGYNRGIIRTIANVIAYVFGIMAAIKLTPVVTAILQRAANSDNPFYYVTSFVLILFVIIVLIRMVAKGMENVFQAAYLGPVNRIMGAGITALLSTLIFSVLLSFAVKTTFLTKTDPTLAQSRTYPALEMMPEQAMKVLVNVRPFMEDFWNNSAKWVDQVKQYGLEKTETSPQIYDIHEDRPIKPEEGQRRVSPDGIEYDEEY